MAAIFLARRACDLVERMDDESCHPGRLRRTYAHFDALNRLLSGYGRIYARYLQPALRAGARTILDVGAGGGDIAMRMYRRAAADGFDVQVTAIDTDDRAVRFMHSRGIHTQIDVRHASTRDLLTAGESFDIVLSNNVMHHMDSDSLTGFLQDSESLATALVVHNDIRRDDLAFVAFLPALVLFPGSFIGRDGLTSIRRSYRSIELAELVPSDWQVLDMAPFRTVCLWQRQ